MPSKINRTRAVAEAYPATIYSPPRIPDLSRAEERRRLSPGALRAFFNIMKRWEVRDEDARQLLGEVSNGAYYLWKQKATKTLEQDRLTRISYLIGIFKSLNILYGTTLADQWIRLPNSNPLFEGHTPLDYMLRGGTQAMQIVRQLLDARRGG